MEKKEPYIIGITGGSGSGKTSFVQDLLQSFSEDEIAILTMDNYYFPREDQKEDDQGIRNFDLVTAIDIDSFVADLKRIIAGETLIKQEYVFNNDKKQSSEIVVKSTPVILVEGLFVMSKPAIRSLLNLSVFIHAKENLKLIRRIKRDKTERNYPLEDVLYRYENHVLPSFESYIKPYVDDVDLIINNNTGFENGATVLKQFIQSKLY